MTNTAKHTPGTWRNDQTVNQGHMIGIWSEPRAYHSKIKPFLIASVRVSKHYPGEGEVNAHLIAAAPNLLEALKEVVAISDRKHDAWDRAHAAIAKATGGQL